MIFKTVKSPNIVGPRTHQVSASITAEEVMTGDLAACAKLPHGLAQSSKRRKVQYIAGRHCVQQAMKAAVSDQPGANPWAAPAHTSSAHGFISSMTQTGAFVSAAVAHCDSVRYLGIDSETVFSTEALQRLWTLVLTKKEIASFEWSFKAEWDRAVFAALIFSAKQSIIKALAPLKTRQPVLHDLLIVPGTEDTKEFQFELLKTLDGEFVKGYQGSGRFDWQYEHIHTAVEMT
jgi:enterobactin synthetase component D